jgi:uncharacterized protein YjcR
MGRALNVDWTKIKFDYVHGGVSQADLAERYGIKLATITKRIERERWSDMRVEAEQRAFADAAAEASKRRVKELASFNEDDLKIARAIRARVANRLKDTEKAMTVGELRMLSATAESAQRMGRLALNASTDNVGMGGPGGEGPVAVTNVSKEDYLKARQEVVEEF